MNRFLNNFLLAFFALFITTSVFSQNKLVVYPASEYPLLNNDIFVQGRISGEKWQDLSENVTFRNIEYNDDRANLSIIAANNKERKSKNITFENLKINGVYIHDDMACFFVSEHVEEVTFKLIE